MREILAYQVDVFTCQRFRGNPAGVVPDASGLEDREMQQIAAELNNSETAFVLPPDDNDHEIRIRFFTPTTEVLSCGHATIAAHYVRARVNWLPKSKIFHKIGIGILAIEIVPDAGDYKIVMHQANPTFDGSLPESRRHEVVNAFGISNNDLDPRCPVEIASTGHSKVMVGLNSKQRLDRIRPNLARLEILSGEIGCNGYFVFTLDSDEPKVLTHARMFAPAIGISEDPVTGNGNGPLGAYLVRHGLVATKGPEFHFFARQGEAMGRPGEVEVFVEIKEGQPVGVRVAGNAVIAFRARIRL